MTRARKILFVSLGENWITGTEQVLLDLIRSLDRTRFQSVVWCNAQLTAEACRAAGAEVHFAPFGYFFAAGSGRFDLRRYLSYISTGRELVRRHEIDLIHANGAAPLQFCVPTGLLTRRPVLGHLHSDDDRRSRFVFLTHLADLVVGVSQQTVAGLLSDGMDGRRLRVIHNGIDFGRFTTAGTPSRTLRQGLGIPDDAVVIGTVASLIPRKGHDILLRAMAKLRTACPAVHLVIAGEGKERRAYEELIGQLGLHSQVHLLGYTRDPSPLYNSSDVFVLASRSEALPLVLLEAAFFGLPIVATRVGGAAEVVLDGKTGFLVPPEDHDRLADALLRLAQDAGLRRSIGDRARQHALQNFSLASMVEAFQGAYAELLKPDPRKDPRTGPPISRIAPYMSLLRQPSTKRAG